MLSTSRLTGLGAGDVIAGQVTAGAGVTIGALRAHTAAAGFEYGVDLASRECGAKARWLGLTRSAAEIAMMRAIKSALDPAGLFNPGVLFP